MNKNELDINNINQYLDNNNVEHSEILKSLLETDSLYSRKNKIGHITSSMFIISPDFQSVLLILHKKYNKFLAPGGHVDDGEYSVEAALRETLEEVGISNVKFLDNSIFDIDIHKIKEATKNGVVEPEHWHFDVRYLVQALSDDVSLNLDEANGFKWVKLNSFDNVEDASTKRMAQKAIEKIENINKKLKIS